jgi:hypothetical protein
MRCFLREAVPDCRASAPRFEDAQKPGADWGLVWKQSPVAGRQRRGLSITDSLTEAGRLYYYKAFLLFVLFYLADRRTAGLET